VVLVFPLAATADTTEARCDVYPAGEDHTDNSGPCVFSQRQGYITIRRADGVMHELAPDGDTPGNFRDGDGRRVYRQSGLGTAGLIFRFPDESVYLYWAGYAQPKEGPTAPYSTDDYDATTLLRCRSDADSTEVRSCPAGILRMEGGASIVVMAPGGEELTINFLPDYVNTGFGPSEASREGDLWTVDVPGAGVFEVPQAAIDGG
jgi:hypothetical protein